MARKRGIVGQGELRQPGQAPGLRSAAERFTDAYITQAAQQFETFLKRREDPEAQMLAFYRAMHNGMPATEAAGYFLDIEPEEFETLLQLNSTIRHMVKSFEGHVAQTQYSKVVNAEGHQAALRWLETHRPDWKQSSKVDLTTKGESLNLTDEQRADRVAALLEQARARRAGSASGDGGPEG